MAPRRARRDRTVPTIVVLVVVVGGARSERSGREVGPDRGENAGERAARAASGGAGGGGAVVVVVLLLLLLLLLVRLGALFCLMPEEKKRRGDALVWGKRAFCIPFGPSSLSASLLCLMASLVVRKAHGGVWPAFWFARNGSEVWWRDVSTLSLDCKYVIFGSEEGIWGHLAFPSFVREVPERLRCEWCTCLDVDEGWKLLLHIKNS